MFYDNFMNYGGYDGFGGDGVDMMGGFNDGCGVDFGMDMNMRGYRVMKATNRNVQDCIAMQLGVDPSQLDFEKLDDLPNQNDWKHSCFNSGVTKMNIFSFPFEDGSNIVYGICPFFPQCNKVHYYVDRAYV